jgi:adenylate cyclase
MQIRPKTQAQLYQVLSITIFWLLCGGFIAIYKCVNYDGQMGKFIFIVPNNLPLGSFILINLVGPAIGGIIGGSLLVMVLNERLHNRSYLYFQTVNILLFMVFIFTLNSLVSYFFYFRSEITGSEDKFTQLIRLLILDPYAIRNMVTWLIIAFLTLHGLKIYEKYGPGTLLSMFLGRYHRPHEVERVFMFLDLSGSTTLAEQLGHVKFFSLLRDFFKDITDPILNAQGEIYQYVGDEVVISWTKQKAVSGKSNCISCYFDIEEAIYQRQEQYWQKYGVLPAFKAAVHYGKVVVGEMGVIKREIVYSGDILNTTSRMVEQCKLHHQKLLLSNDVLELLSESQRTGYTFVPLGNMILRGKIQKVELFAVQRQQ